MADQRQIKLYSGHATPKTIILRELPVATPSTGTVIYLYQNHATPKNIILRDPTEAPEVGGGGEVNGVAAQTVAAFTQTATGQVWIAGAAAQTIGDFTQVATAQVWNAGLGSQTVGDFTQSATGQVWNAGLASQTVGDFTQVASGELLALPIAVQPGVAGGLKKRRKRKRYEYDLGGSSGPLAPLVDEDSPEGAGSEPVSPLAAPPNDKGQSLEARAAKLRAEQAATQARIAQRAAEDDEDLLLLLAA